MLTHFTGNGKERTTSIMLFTSLITIYQEFVRREPHKFNCRIKLHVRHKSAFNNNNNEHLITPIRILTNVKNVNIRT